MKRLLPVLFGFVFLLLSSTEGWSADFQKGLDAYDKGDYATALREWEPLAEQGDASAQYNLGQMSRKGQGVQQDDKTAVKWYKLAAEQGNTGAQSNLGAMYNEGKGVPQDYKTAVKWIRLAVEQGNAHAQNNLGLMYDRGRGVPQNDETAVKWYTLAAEQGNKKAQSNLDRLQNKIAQVGLEKDKISPSNGSSLPPCPGSPTESYRKKESWVNCFGTHTDYSGDKYVGEWKNGKKHGQGTKTRQNGDKYVGEFKFGLPTGQGTKTFKDGHKYVGEFKFGFSNGQGTFTYASGEKYVGEWKVGKEHGQGTFTYTSGEKYVGEWKDGKEHGQGTLTFADGRVEEGIFENGALLKPAKKLSPTVIAKKSPTKRSSLPRCVGNYISTTWTDCFGTYTNTGGNKYVGEYRDDKKHGQGTMTYANGVKYVGGWKDGEYHGQGTFTYADGKKRIFENDKFLYAKKPSPTVIGTSEKTPKTKPKRNISRSPSVIGTSEKTPKVDQQKRLELARRTQEALQVLGLYSGKLDGIIGVITKSAIQRWQKRNGYTGTGEVNELQLAKLEQEAITHLATKKSKPTVTAKKIELKPVQKVAKRPDDIAVIIANSNYTKQGKGIPNVKPAYTDAKNIKKYFMESLGVREGNIIYLKDATGTQLTSVFGSNNDHRGKLFNWTKRNVSKVYVYYAGHGAPAGDKGTTYLVPSDADSETVQLTGYPLKQLYKNLGKVPATSITVILEACFSGQSQSGYLSSQTSGIRVVPVMPSAPKKITVISAGAANQVATWEKNGSQSLFTKYFLKGMSGEGDKKPYGNENGKVSLKELKKYLDGNMTYYARRYYGRTQQAQIVVNGKELSPTN